MKGTQMNTIDYTDWKIQLEEIVDDEEIISIVDRLNFKGYMSGVVGIDENGSPLEVKTRAVSRLSELLEYDFSNCFLYKIEKVKHVHYFLPEGKNPWDYDFVELEKFDREDRYGYRIRYANKEEKKATAE